MKKSLYLVMGLVAVVPAINSCVSDKEFLTEEPKTVYTIENEFIGNHLDRLLSEADFPLERSIHNLQI